MEVRKWVAEIVQDDRTLFVFLEKFLQSGASFFPGDTVAESHDRLYPEWVWLYLDPDQIAARVETLVQSGAGTERQKRALKQFIKEYAFRKSGGNPDSPLGFADLTGADSGRE